MGQFGANSCWVTIFFMTIFIHIHTSDALNIEVPPLDQIKNLYSKVCSDVNKEPRKTCGETADLISTRVKKLSIPEAPSICERYINQVKIDSKGVPLLKQPEEIMDICKKVVEVTVPISVDMVKDEVEHICTRQVEGVNGGNNEKKDEVNKTQCLDVPLSFDALCFKGVIALCNSIEESFPFFKLLDELCTLTLTKKICGEALQIASAETDYAPQIVNDGNHQVRVTQASPLTNDKVSQQNKDQDQQIQTTQATPLFTDEAAQIVNDGDHQVQVTQASPLTNDKVSQQNKDQDHQIQTTQATPAATNEVSQPQNDRHRQIQGSEATATPLSPHTTSNNLPTEILDGVSIDLGLFIMEY